jgi:chromosome segregation ATPase
LSNAADQATTADAPDIIEQLDALAAKAAEIADNQTKLSTRQADLYKRVGNLETALSGVMERLDSVTEVSRKADHALQQLGVHAETVQGAAEAHGSTNALGQNVLEKIAELRSDMEEFARAQNRPFGRAA